MKQTCKIIHVLYSGLGGHGNVFFSFVHAKENEGLEYEALFYGIEDLRSEYISKCNTANIAWQFVKKGKRLDAGYYKKIIQALHRSDADIIFLHSSTLLLPAKMAAAFGRKQKKIIVRETQANHLKTKWEWLYLKLSLRFADAIVFLTEEYKSEVTERLPYLMRRNQRKMHVIPNGLDTNRFSPSLLAPTEELTFSMQSRLVNIKDYKTLLRSFATFLAQSGERKATLKIAGDGPERKILEALTRELKISDHVSFKGMLNEEELISFLQSTTIYIHATLGETMSTAIMQAMACQLPIIASNVPGVNNMITDGEDGLLVEVENMNALTAKMLLLFTDRAFSKKLAVAGRKKAETQYSNAVMHRRYMSIISLYCTQ